MLLGTLEAFIIYSNGDLNGGIEREAEALPSLAAMERWSRGGGELGGDDGEDEVEELDSFRISSMLR